MPGPDGSSRSRRAAVRQERLSECFRSAHRQAARRRIAADRWESLDAAAHRSGEMAAADHELLSVLRDWLRSTSITAGRIRVHEIRDAAGLVTLIVRARMLDP